MTLPLLLALVAAAAPAPGTPRVLLKPAAAAAPGCRTTPAEGGLVSARLFTAETDACPVAYVGEEPVLLGELAGAVEFMHLKGGMGRRGAKPPEIDLRPPLDRIISVRLLVQEAREMGLDQTPELAETMKEFQAERLRAKLQASAAKGAKPDPAEVDRLYRDAVREWKLKSVLLEKEEDAKALAAELAAGKGFDALVDAYLKDGKAKGGGPAEFAPRKEMLPAVLDAVREAKVGAAVGPVKVASGWAVLRVDGTRHPKGNAEVLAQAREASLKRVEHEAVRRFYLGLVAKYARVDQALLASLDLEVGGEKGYDAFLSDTRPLATIEGEAPVTVADLAREVAMKFFHGLESPIREKRVNAQKEPAFEKLLVERLFAKEAAARKLDQDPAFQREVAAHERMQVFNAFLEKVILPEIQVTEGEAQGYYQEHLAEFSAPEMYKLDGLAFPGAAEAQVALDKLKAGTDFAWMQTNAPGQIAPERRSLQFDGRTLSASAMPAALVKSVAGAAEGEYRLHAAGRAEVYVLKLVAHTPPSPRPYYEVREKIVKQVYAQKVTRAIDEYATKLRAVQKVDVLVARVSM